MNGFCRKEVPHDDRGNFNRFSSWTGLYGFIDSGPTALNQSDRRYLGFHFVFAVRCC